MLNLIDRIIDLTGRVVSLLIFVLIGILLYGVFARYVVNSPSIWVSELSGMIYGCYFLLGGSYALLHGDHVNVDILRSRLPVRGQAVLDLLTYIFFYLFIGVIFWLGIQYAYKSVARLETSATVWGPYIWPVKLMLPLSALLMLAAGIRKTLTDIKLVFRI